MTGNRLVEYRPVSRRRRILLGTAVALALLVALAPMLARTGAARRLVEGRISNALGRPVEIERLDAAWTSGVTVTGLVVRNGAAEFGGEPFLEARTVRLENALPTLFSVSTFTNYTSSDYNGFRPNPGAPASFEWNSPPVSTLADFTGPGHNARLETRRFATLAEYTKATGQDAHSVLVDYDVFMNVPKLDAQDAATVQKLYDARDIDFRLRAGSAAVDRGVALPAVTDGFNGRAPDLGALEAGSALPTYGPRPTSPR